jgi:hypothetical protein
VNLLLLAAIVMAVAGASVALMSSFIAAEHQAPASSSRWRRAPGSSPSSAPHSPFCLRSLSWRHSGASTTRSGAESEATSVVELSRNSEFFARADRERLAGRLICYARAVISDEWPAMEHGERSPLVQRWVEDMGQALRQIDVRTPSEEVAFLQLLDQEETRVEGRRVRLSESIRDLPAPAWFILGLVAALTIGFPLLFADRRESFLVEGSLIAAIAALVTAGLLLVWFLDHPYANEAGSIKPTEMGISLGIVEEEQPDVVPPCDSAGERSAE